jgi:hypothetical protein
MIMMINSINDWFWWFCLTHRLSLTHRFSRLKSERFLVGSCQAHRDSIVYLVTKRRRSEKWERKKELWELINLRRLFSLINFFSIDHLTRRLTRNRDIIFFSIVIRQNSFDASCLSDETILTSRFCVNIVSFDARDRSLFSNDEFHLFFHFIQNVFNHVFCLLYIFLSSAERVDEMRH